MMISKSKAPYVVFLTLDDICTIIDALYCLVNNSIDVDGLKEFTDKLSATRKVFKALSSARDSNTL